MNSILKALQMIGNITHEVCRVAVTHQPSVALLATYLGTETMGATPSQIDALSKTVQSRSLLKALRHAPAIVLESSAFNLYNDVAKLWSFKNTSYTQVPLRTLKFHVFSEQNLKYFRWRGISNKMPRYR